MKNDHLCVNNDVNNMEDEEKKSNYNNQRLGNRMQEGLRDSSTPTKEGSGSDFVSPSSIPQGLFGIHRTGELTFTQLTGNESGDNQVNDLPHIRFIDLNDNELDGGSKFSYLDAMNVDIYGLKPAVEVNLFDLTGNEAFDNIGVTSQLPDVDLVMQQRIRAIRVKQLPVFIESQCNGPTRPSEAVSVGPCGSSGLVTKSKRGRVDYFGELRSTNPNTVVKIAVDKDTDPFLPTRVFKRLYVCLGALKYEFRACRREVLGLDSAFIKGPFLGQVLAAVGIDPNNRIYPLAYALVEAKKKSLGVDKPTRMLCRDVNMLQLLMTLKGVNNVETSGSGTSQVSQVDAGVGQANVGHGQGGSSVGLV
ncbi:hypothetical protein Tco_0782188 [Tanacetum coccineum]